MWCAWILALTAATANAAPPPWPASAVIVGVAGVNDRATNLYVLTVRNRETRREDAGVVAHQPGMVPAGVVVDDHRLLLSVQDGSTRDARIVVHDAGGTQRSVLDEAIPGQAPLVAMRDGHTFAWVVRELDPTPAGSTFDIVRIDFDDPAAHREVVASRRALWVTPVRGSLLPPCGPLGALHEECAPLRMLVKDDAGSGVDGAAHIDVIDAGAFQPSLALPRVPARSPVAAGGRVWLEVNDVLAGRGRAALRVFAPTKPQDPGVVVVRGLAGLSPVARGNTLAVGTGRKDGTVKVGSVGVDDEVVVDGGGLAAALLERPIGRAGVARPQAVTSAGDVVVWLDRGAALPGELWWVPAPPTAPTLLLAPPPRTALVVYGVVDTTNVRPASKETR
jgi:hypothetical protein